MPSLRLLVLCCVCVGLMSCNECESALDCEGHDFVCRQIACEAGECKPHFSAAKCDDENQCTSNLCPGDGVPLQAGEQLDSKGCLYRAQAAACSDSNLCTKDDACSGKTCTGTLLDCDDSNPCTADSCGATTGCVHGPASNGAVCSGGKSCVLSGQCVNGTCQGQAAGNGTACSDGNACTTNDACAAGSCVGGAAPDCDDKQPCTNDSCAPATGCVHANNTAACSDGNACTTNDTCQAGNCVAVAAPPCDDDNPCTDDGCAPATGCVYVNNSAVCDDGNGCTASDTCAAGVCAGVGQTCDDGVGCTTDTCSLDTGCKHVADPGVCDDGLDCTTDTCDPVADCQHVAANARFSLDATQYCPESAAYATVNGYFGGSWSAATDSGAVFLVNSGYGGSDTILRVGADGAVTFGWFTSPLSGTYGGDIQAVQNMLYYVASNASQTSIYQIDTTVTPPTGTELWSFANTSFFDAIAVVNAATLYIASAKPEAYPVSSATAPKSAATVYPSLAVADLAVDAVMKRLYAVSPTGPTVSYIQLPNAVSLTALGSVPPGAFVSIPSIAIDEKGAVYAACTDYDAGMSPPAACSGGAVYRLDPATGAVKAIIDSSITVRSLAYNAVTHCLYLSVDGASGAHVIERVKVAK